MYTRPSGIPQYVTFTFVVHRLEQGFKRCSDCRIKVRKVGYNVSNGVSNANLFGENVGIALSEMVALHSLFGNLW